MCLPVQGLCFENRTHLRQAWWIYNSQNPTIFVAEKFSLYTQNKIRLFIQWTCPEPEPGCWTPHTVFLPPGQTPKAGMLTGKRRSTELATAAPPTLGWVNSHSGESSRTPPTNIRFLWNIVLYLKIHVSFTQCSVIYLCLMWKCFQWLKIKGCSRKLHHATLPSICSLHIEKCGGKSFKRLKMFLHSMCFVVPNTFLQIIRSTLG